MSLLRHGHCTLHTLYCALHCNTSPLCVATLPECVVCQLLFSDVPGSGCNDGQDGRPVASLPVALTLTVTVTDYILPSKTKQSDGGEVRGGMKIV